MANALQNLTSSAKPAGVSIDEIFAIMSTLTGVTGDANKVITQLNGAINAIAAPTTEASAKFKELGIEVGQTAIEEKGFVEVAKEIYDAVGGNQEALRKLIPEIEASKLIIALATTQNDKYKESLDQVTTGAGNLEEAVKKMSETTDFKLKVARQKWENFKTRTGNVLVTTGAFLIDFGNVVIGTFKIIGTVIEQGLNAILGFGTVSGLAIVDTVANFKEFARVIPIFVKKALNNLPQIASIALRKFLGVFGDLGDTISDKLGLAENLEGVFEDVDTNFNFTNTTKTLDHVVDTAIKNNKKIEQEWGKITDIVTGNSKEQQLAVKETLDEIKNLDQSFGGLGDTASDTGDSQGDLTKSIGGTTDALKEQEEAEKKAEELLAEKKKTIESLGQTNSKVYGEILEDIENGVDGLEKYIEGIQDVNDKIEELKEDATENIRDINNELGNLETTGKTELAERYLEVLEETKEAEENLKEAESYEDRKKIKEELKDLEEERLLIEKNTTDEQRKQAKELDGLSEAQKTINDTAEAQKILEEKKKIYEAIQNGEKINLDEIQDYENIKLAEGLIAKQVALDTELDTLKASLEQQRLALLEINEEKKKFEADWTQFFGTEINKQVDHAKKLQKELKRIIALQKEAGIENVQLGTTATKEQEDRINQSVDNSKKVDVNINATSDVDIDVAVAKISETIK